MSGPIDLITAAPDENNPDTLPTEIDSFVQQIKAAIPQLNAVITAFNFNATNSTSTTSLAIATGVNKTFTLVETSRSYTKGQTLKCAYDADNWMLGEVVSYNSGTNALVVKMRVKNGSGTYADWTISLAATPQDVGDHCVWAHTGIGFGSVKSKHRRYGATKTNVGTAITYADDASNGATFTINEGGHYEMIMGDRNATAGRDVYFGIAVNSSSGTTNIQGDAAQLIYAYRKDNDITPLTITEKLAAGDVVTAKGGTGSTFMPDATGQQDSFFIIRKVSNG